MAQGVTLIDPARIDVRGPITVGRDVLLDVNVVLEGPVQLADRRAHRPQLRAQERQRRCAHRAVRQLRAAGRADRQRLPDRTVHAHATRQCSIADGVHLGNFVEIKNSDIGAGSKVNHLSYVGDSEVGSAVNVGAGTITCNYDGANKWRTEIGDGAFIGSGAMLVAPVKIGDGATIGAGSTITSDAPADKLTLASVAPGHTSNSGSGRARTRRKA